MSRLVLLSGRGEEEARRAELAVADAGPEWTVLRCSWFSQNFSEGAFLDGVGAGELTLPVGDVPEPFIDLDDVADAAVAALTEDGHAGRVYEMTGPRSMLFEEAAGEIAEAGGVPVRIARVSMDDFSAALTQAGLGADELWLLRYLFTELLDGRNATTGDGVQQALGREPRDFRDYARAAAAAGAWNDGGGR